jgi:type IV secretion system protein VirB11
MSASHVYLHSYLGAFADTLARPDVTDIYVNRPGEMWVETLGGETERHDAPRLDEATLARLVRQIAAQSSQGISREHPILSATLPDGARVQVVAPPATRGPLALAIRKHIVTAPSLGDYIASGAFANTDCSEAERDRSNEQLGALHKAGDLATLLATAVRTRRNILVAGGTSTGKTTFLNALLREVPLSERLILIEDTPELQVDHPNRIGLLAARSVLGEAAVTSEDLLNASLRMRPDRIILGELRGPEAFSFLRAVNTGHPGSMTTIHADSPARAVDQLALLVLQSGARLTYDNVVRYVETTIDVYVQLERTAGRRFVSRVELGRRRASSADTV